VRENLAFGRPDATEEELVHAARLAQAHEFVERLPDGYDTVIGERGITLSGGQRQRLAIARALVRRPEIYVFDEAFSALDLGTDARLRAALRPETREASVIIVAQRVSTIVDADQIAVLDNGAIVGLGTHEELLRDCPPYVEIVESQLSADAA
jgi:ATP-binding cassette, subfamily B, multidrug efflux pump